MDRRFGFLLLFVFVYLTQWSEVLGQELRIGQPPNTGLQVGGRTGTSLAQTLYNSAVTIIYSIAVLAFIIMLIWGAFDVLTSGGNKDKIAAGHKRITNAIIGIVVLAFVFFIATVLGEIIGLKLTGPLQLPSLLGAPSGTSSAGGNVQ